MLDSQDFSDFHVGDIVVVPSGGKARIERIGRSTTNPHDPETYAWVGGSGWYATSITLVERDREHEEAVAVLGEDYFA
jgi:hypothetical protein